MMVANYVLIDYENVQPDILPLVDCQQMHVIVFIGAGQKSVPCDLAAAMQRMGKRASYIRSVGKGPNALDFHIAFYLGALAARDPAAFFYIVSKDKGYEPLIQHLQSLKINVRLVADVRDLPIVEKFRSSPPPSSLAPARDPNSLPSAGTPSVARMERNGHPGVPSTPAHGANATNGVASITADGASAQRSHDEQMRTILARLQRHPSTRPGRVDALRNYIHTLFGQRLTRSEVDFIVARMQRAQLIAIDEHQRITYHLSDHATAHDDHTAAASLHESGAPIDGSDHATAHDDHTAAASLHESGAPIDG
ncbi:MAG: PIN domain-containing protein, partial [Anaerolineae bacterium]|nr:PIN domain-containing protein [Anaerolineae bacterium]